MFANINTKQIAIMSIAFFAVAILLPEMAYAENALQTVLCNVVEWLTGPVGSAIATLAVIVIGIGALMGKVSWGMAIIVIIGIGIVFGAPTLVGLVAEGSGGTGGGYTDCG